MFCGEMKADLRAHFMSVHQEEENIKELGTQEKDRIQAIAALRDSVCTAQKFTEQTVWTLPRNDWWARDVTAAIDITAWQTNCSH